MNCPECLDYLQVCLDGAAADSAEASELENHLVSCRHCRELHAAASRLSEGLRLLDGPQPPADLSRRITAKVLRARGKARRRLTVTVALAAGILFAILLYARRSSVGQIAEPLAEQSYATVPGRSPAPPVNESALQVGQAFVSLAQRAADDTLEQSRWLIPLVVPPDSRSTSPRASLSWERPASSLTEVRTGISKGLEPVSTCAQRAVDLLLREVPSVDPQRRTG
jgi:hypothetical protein